MGDEKYLWVSHETDAGQSDALNGKSNLEQNHLAKSALLYCCRGYDLLATAKRRHDGKE